ncbi:hypothetical protein TTHERM_00384700 (macronuclear) [Tetrahymena thermophila SB210]|uniref:Uncharacterized protein n=1 Tax=Tetrahymena thermophila (strain SB210) TaxID=312017 RepID=Q23RM2_TETTS|nr:hypothetical protein TTHERM_00384700 [Tetrahymena thermophila SB210]EAR99026.2 hypothetical protein TTHERM_00384700 [Tetrahymena thermophila SB210]|eukprot:XP_001019271.2 hypothetical protein TTHERM_00384700 [Tetrahymena thermophila SB210]
MIRFNKVYLLQMYFSKFKMKYNQTDDNLNKQKATKWISYNFDYEENSQRLMIICINKKQQNGYHIILIMKRIVKGKNNLVAELDNDDNNNNLNKKIKYKQNTNIK